MTYHILETSFVGPALVALWKKISPENSLDPSVAEAEFKEYRECCMGHSTYRTIAYTTTASHFANESQL